MNNSRKYNIIGCNFNQQDRTEYKQYVIHVGRRLVPKPDAPGVLWCTNCGWSYLEKEAPSEEQLRTKFAVGHKTRILTAKTRRKKYYDKQGNEITDPDLIANIQRGPNVISYHEEKSREGTIIDTENRRIILSKLTKRSRY
jgi:hypothetical protein